VFILSTVSKPVQGPLLLPGCGGAPPTCAYSMPGTLGEVVLVPHTLPTGVVGQAGGV
jgi:hypothetical protein